MSTVPVRGIDDQRAVVTQIEVEPDRICTLHRHRNRAVIAVSFERHANRIGGARVVFRIAEGDLSLLEINVDDELIEYFLAENQRHRMTDLRGNRRQIDHTGGDAPEGETLKTG